MQRFWAWVFAGCLALAFGACSAEPAGPGGPARGGVLHIQTSTTGDSLDSDGYVLSIDGTPVPDRLLLNSDRRISDLPPGSHSLKLRDVAGQCVTRDLGDALSILVRSAPESLTINFRVTCAGRLSRLDDRILWETDRNGDQDIFAMRPNGDDVVNVTNNGWHNVTVAVSPDGFEISYLRVSFSSSSGCPQYEFGICWGGGSAALLYAMRADRTGPRWLLAHVPFGGPPQWSPDWGRIALVQTDCSTLIQCTRWLFVANADGTGLRAVTDPSTVYWPSSPQWSPDGTRIAFVAQDSASNAEPGLYVLNVDRTSVARLLRHDAIAEPAWSPSGTRLAFTASVHPASQPTTTYNELLVVNADGTGEQRLTFRNRYPQAPAWSPDGTRIAFFSGSDLFVINADGTSETQLTTGGQGESFAWSPDGTQLAFDSLRAGNWEVYTVNVDGSGLRNLTNHPSQDRHPTWTRSN